ncbi:hypothetical protein Sme01_00410 [Sphaerisporangium melleum]|uniref:2-oxo-4-hydroxy-4-carboxy-5-ureidoimidazoline decarboxylase n=1 Tax=Sphaerisporangium melleum TaxID=321316 RepID=A0A917RJ27_9ACTN|nr:2-oxo-4-hydroxy-4-carboxy-5-ureidoimidazoline decarboxylase [Sphaerisporangium melleum]GGL09451.1 hypothetical protein GCM10007964_59630 [Sphaerisporangium melleum]GII67565.1 hypothetical protein Sme01_00410 [Sphaerisporangium melleum]
MPNVTPGRPGLSGLNALSPPEAERELLSCCAAPAFARRVAGARPFADAATLGAAVREAVRGLSWPEVLEALSAHPRIGDRPAGEAREASWSRAEQSGTAGADRKVLAGLAAGNAEYERRFGHVYLVCATGLSAPEMLDRLRDRLGNDEDAERSVVREELAEIAALRALKLAKLAELAAGDAPGGGGRGGGGGETESGGSGGPGAHGRGDGDREGM